MSDSIIVFVRKSNLPEIDALREALAADGLKLEPSDEDAIEDVVGYWPGDDKGVEVGFEFSCGEVDEDDLENWDIESDQLDGRNYCVDIAFRTESDLSASALCAAYFCKACDAITFDDNDELTINASTCDSWLKQYR